MLDFDIMVLAAAISASTVWLAHAGQRLNVAWHKVSQRVRKLKNEQRHEVQTLAKHGKEIERLNGEMAETRRHIETAVQATAARRQELKNFTPPAAKPIYVTSEFPAAKQQKAWVAKLKRIDGLAGNGDVNRHLLIWAGDYQTALSRAEQLYSRQQYQVVNVTRLE